ncbi:MAG TPA: glycosyltransferase [Prolixibacteraceae bacterium]|jgi:alpha-1,3-rhamnosyltransferase
MKNDNPLVSIAVITYNSSEYILETLESVKAQTYQNIELVVSDDCSSDNTIEICKKWIKKNKDQFRRSELITMSTNSGVPSNCNRALYKSKGTWIKYIAGDDILNENCISKFIYHAKNDNFKHNFLFCNKTTFIDNITKIQSQKISKIIERSYDKQLIKFACTRPTIAPFLFINKDALLKLNGFDESYHLLEDSPLYFKALKNNNFFLPIDEDLVYYRLTDNSISNSDMPSVIFTKELRKFIELNIIPYLFSKGLLFNILKTNIEYNNKNNSLTNFYLKIINKLAQVERKFIYCI